MELPKVTIGVIFYNSQKYIEYFLESIRKQTHKDYELFILINGSNHKEYELVKKMTKNCKKTKVFFSEKNLGFGGGHNFLINKSLAFFYFCINPDLVLDKKALNCLVQKIEKIKKLGALAPSIFQWNFESKKKTKIVDSLGISLFSNFKAIDIHQGLYDNFKLSPFIKKKKIEEFSKSQLQPDFLKTKDILLFTNCMNLGKENIFFGVSGAAVLFRREALNDVLINKKMIKKVIEEFDNSQAKPDYCQTQDLSSLTSNKYQYFDEFFYFLKEDIDLSFRLRWAGWNLDLCQDSFVWHDRSTGKMSWFKKSKFVRVQSFLNHCLLVRRYYNSGFSFRVKFSIFWREFWRRLFVLIFDFGVFWKYLKFMKRYKKDFDKVIFKKRIKVSDLEKLFVKK